MVEQSGAAREICQLGKIDEGHERVLVAFQLALLEIQQPSADALIRVDSYPHGQRGNEKPHHRFGAGQIEIPARDGRPEQDVIGMAELAQEQGPGGLKQSIEGDVVTACATVQPGCGLFVQFPGQLAGTVGLRQLMLGRQFHTQCRWRRKSMEFFHPEFARRAHASSGQPGQIRFIPGNGWQHGGGATRQLRIGASDLVEDVGHAPSVDESVMTGPDEFEVSHSCVDEADAEEGGRGKIETSPPLLATVFFEAFLLSVATHTTPVQPGPRQDDGLEQHLMEILVTVLDKAGAQGRVACRDQGPRLPESGFIEWIFDFHA